MRGQAILADRDAFSGQARLHHPPPQDALRSAKEKDDREPRSDGAVDATLPKKDEERKQEHDAQQAAEHAMSPFPPIDRLEAGETDSAIDEIILRGALIFGEFRLPSRVVQWRNDARDRLPF